MIGRRGARGFTLLELIIALAIVGALLAIVVGALRVGLASWARAEERAEVHQHLRSVTLILSRAVAGVHPYRAPRGEAPTPRLLFQGAEGRLELVTLTPPLPASVPVAFTAVVIALETEDGPALVIRQRVLPNRDPFTEATITLRDPSVHTLAFQYLDPGGAWQDAWDGEALDALPQAVRIAVATTRDGRTTTLPPMIVTLRTASKE